MKVCPYCYDQEIEDSAITCASCGGVSQISGSQTPEVAEECVLTESGESIDLRGALRFLAPPDECTAIYQLRAGGWIVHRWKGPDSWAKEQAPQNWWSALLKPFSSSMKLADGTECILFELPEGNHSRSLGLVGMGKVEERITSEKPKGVLVHRWSDDPTIPHEWELVSRTNLPEWAREEGRAVRVDVRRVGDLHPENSLAERARALAELEAARAKNNPGGAPAKPTAGSPNFSWDELDIGRNAPRTYATPRTPGPKLENLGALGCCTAVICLSIFWVFGTFNPTPSQAGPAQSAPAVPGATYDQGYQDGIRDGRSLAETNGLTESQVDSVIDSVVAEKSAQIRSRGQQYGDGWVAGLRAGAKQRVRR